MATHIVLVKFTDKGLRQIYQSPDRVAAFSESTKEMGIEVEGAYWTSGGYDGVLLMNAPDEETALAATLSLSRGGFVRTQTLRAFERPQIVEVLGKL